MPVPATIEDLVATAASNSPQGTESVGTNMDDFLRAHASIVRAVYERYRDGLYMAASASGTVNDIALTVAATYPGYVFGQEFDFVATGANTGPVTVNLNSLGAKPLTKAGLNPLSPGDLISGAVYKIKYDGARFQMVSAASTDATLLVPTGTVLAYAGTTAPVGYLACAGQGVSRASYAALFGAIGTAYGLGDGSTTFNVPDLRCRAPIGWDVSPVAGPTNRVTAGVSGINAGLIGSAGGSEYTQTHTHGATSIVSDPGHAHAGVTRRGSAVNMASSFAPALDIDNVTTDVANTNISVSTSIGTAGAGAAQNVQPSLVLYYIIKT